MIAGLLRLRFAAGVCVLAAGLLMGAGGTVAVADPGSSGSAAHGDDGTKASGQPHSTDAKESKDEPVGTASKDGSLGSGGQSGQQPSSGAKKPKVEPVGTDTKVGTKDDSDLGAAVPDPVAAVPNEVARVSEVAVAPVSEVVAPVSELAVAPVSDVVAPVSGVVGPVSDVSALVQDMLTSVAGAVIPLTQLPSDLYSFLLGIAEVAPVSDVIALVQDMLRSVAEAIVLLAQLPSDLFSFLLGIAGVQPVVGGLGGSHGRGRSAAAGASVASRLPLGLRLAGISGPPLAGISGLPLAGNAATEVATLDVNAVGRASAVSGMAPLAPDAAFPIGAGSSFRHVFGEILLPVSLWALAAGALPGAGGLGFITLAGVRVGYRQAKAGVALRITGIAHFAHPGPLGVVRPKALRFARPGALSADHLLDKVA